MNFKEVKRVLIGILILNWLVAFAKILLGFFSGSLGILTDGIHSLFDGGTNIVGLVGIKFAGKPADKDHPYGHRKYEAIASMIILVFLGITVYEVIESIFRKLSTLSNPPTIHIDWFYFLVLGACIIVDYVVARYEYRKAIKLDSIILKVDSTHTKSHYITTGAVILGFILIKLGLPVWIDLIVAAFVIFYIIRYLALGILKDIMAVLSDRAIIDDDRVRKIVEEMLGSGSCHEIRSRGDKGHIFMDLHIVLKGNIFLAEAHQICDRLEGMVKAEIPEVQDITIHLEPSDKRNPR